MMWVKGELLTDINSDKVDPTRQLDRLSQAVLFYRREWFARVWQHFGADAISPLIARATSEGSIAWLFLVRLPRGEATALSNWYSFAYNAVYRGNPDDVRKRAMLRAIAARLAKVRPRLSRITLGPVPRADGSSELIARAFASAQWKPFALQTSSHWTANVAGQSFADYWAARPGQLRSTYTRKMAKVDFDIVLYDRFDEDAWADYETVYAQSWKPDEGMPEFVRETVEHEGAAGCLRLGICKIDGVAVAAQYWTVENGTAYIHKLAHTESAKACSPGTILSHAMFRHVIDTDKVAFIDFGTGDDPYKADWMDHGEPLDTIVLHNLRTVDGLWSAFMTTLKLRISGRRAIEPNEH